MSDALFLKRNLSQRQIDDNGDYAKHDGKIYSEPEKANAKEWQIEDQQNARETNNFSTIGMKSLPILLILVQQFLVRDSPSRDGNLWFHIFAVLRHSFNDEHFDGPGSGNEFQTELIKECLF